MLVLIDTRTRVEAITGVAGRRYWPGHEELHLAEESPAPERSDGGRQEGSRNEQLTERPPV